MLYNLESGEAKEKTLEERFTMGSVFALWDEERVVGVGDAPATTRAFRVTFASGKCKELAPMGTKRRFPGAIRYGAFIYVFGSGEHPVLSSCEKYSPSLNTWSPMPNMSAGKWAFSPCLSGTRIYLLCTTSSEIYDPKRDTFEVLPLFAKPTDGCVSFLARDTIHVISYSGLIGMLHLKLGAWEVKEFTLSEETNALSNLTPVVYSGMVYWINYSNGTLVKFDIALGRIQA
jgi:hypothetical protein